MGPSLFWTPLSNLRMMTHYPSLCTGNLHTLTSTCSGTVTITSQPNLVSSTPSPMGPKQCVASLICSNRKRTTSGRLSPNANIPNGLWTRWRKDLTGLPVRLSIGSTTKALQPPKLPLMKSKLRVILSYPTHKVFVKASKICGRYGIQTCFKGGSTIKNLLVSLKDKDPMVNQSGDIYWYQCGDLGCDDEYIGEPPGPLVKDTRNT